MRYLDETDANNYGLGLKRASLNSIKAFFVILEKFCHFFDFDAFCVVLAHKKAFSIFLRANSKGLDFAVTSSKSTLLGRLPLMSGLFLVSEIVRVAFIPNISDFVA